MKHKTGAVWTRRLNEADEARKKWLARSRAVRAAYEMPPEREGLTDFPILWTNEQNILAALALDSVETRMRSELSSRQEAARVAQAVVNWELHESRCVKPANRSFNNGRIEGVGILEVKWGGPFAPRVVTGEGADTAVAGSPTDNGRPRETSREAEEQEAIRKVFPNDLTGKSMPRTYCVTPRDFLKDPGTSTIEDSIWVAKALWLYRRQIEGLIAAGFFRKVDYGEVLVLPSAKERMDERSATRAISSGRGKDRGDGGYEDEDQVVQVWEIHDREERRILYVCPGFDEPLREIADEMDVKRPLFADFRPAESDPSSFWTMPEAAQYLEAQRTLSEFTQHMVEMAAKHAKKGYAVDPRIGEDELTAIEQADDGFFLRVPPDAIREVNFGGAPDGMLQATMAYLKSICRESSGVTGVIAGVSSSPAITATETERQAQAYSVRLKRQEIVRDAMLRDVAGMYLDLSQQFLPVDRRTFRLLGTDAAIWEQEHLSISREDIEGEFDIEVTTGSRAKSESAVDLKLMLDVWNLAALNPNTNQRALLEELFRRAGMNPNAYVLQARPGTGLPPQDSGSLAGAGRSPEEMGGVPAHPEMPALSADQRRRTGSPTAASAATDMMRGGATRG